jgi:NADPH:quinone reductase-like Zn-dependent oxidoreductase
MEPSPTRPPAAADVDGADGTTRAVTQQRYGPPGVLTLTRRPKPRPGPGEVVVRVHVAAVNARDWHMMRGEPRLARLLDRSAFAARRPRVPTRGTDMAGVVEAVGPDVTRWQPGDAVFGEGVGTFAEHALAPADQLAAVPDGVSFEQAAALPLAASTAMMCLTAAEPRPASHVLINGASGGVGTFAVQLARHLQHHVTAVVSPRNAALAAELGANRIIDYTSSDFTDDDLQYDLVIDLVGNRRLAELRRIIRPGGALVLSGGGVSGDGRTVGPLKLLIGATAAARFLPFQVLTPQASPTSELLTQLGKLVATGRIRPIIDRRFPLEETADAIRYLETEHATAKVLITIKSPESPEPARGLRNGEQG